MRVRKYLLPLFVWFFILPLVLTSCAPDAPFPSSAVIRIMSPNLVLIDVAWARQGQEWRLYAEQPLNHPKGAERSFERVLADEISAVSRSGSQVYVRTASGSVFEVFNPTGRTDGWRTSELSPSEVAVVSASVVFQTVDQLRESTERKAGQVQ
jgi:hypothetical protein